MNPFKTLLDSLFNRAKDLLDHATTDGLILETNGSEQVLNIIANAQRAYDNELSATSNTLSDQEQAIISGITGLLDQVQNHTIKNISEQITQVALLIPIVGNHPQVTTWSGNTIYKDQPVVSIKLKGIFKHANDHGYEPTMKIGDDTYKVIEKTQTYLSFEVPIEKFNFLNDKVSYKLATFEIPYTHFLFGKKAEYKLKLILLPINPGKFEFFISTTEGQLERKDKVCELIWAGHEDLPKYCLPDPGYTIDVATILKQLTEEHGKGFGHDHWDLGSDFNNPTSYISFHIKSDSDDSFVRYRISYSMTREVFVPKDENLTLNNIKWFNSQAITKPDRSTWKAVYTQFDGRKVVFISSSEDNQFVRIKQDGNQIVVSFAPFD